METSLATAFALLTMLLLFYLAVLISQIDSEIQGITQPASSELNKKGLKACKQQCKDKGKEGK
jgi:hypothetical protein